MRLRKKTSRRGITLFEVVIALVVFTTALPALIVLIETGTRRAEESAIVAQASVECRSKLAEVMVGAQPLSDADWAPLDDANWYWKMSATAGDSDMLRQVQVWVKFDQGSLPVQVTLVQTILDPSYRGSTQDRSLLSGGSTSSDSSSSDSSSSSGTSSGGTP